MKSIRRGLGLALAAALTLSFAACTGGDTTGGSGDTTGAGDPTESIDSIIVAISAPDTLLPGNHIIAYELLESVFAPLISINENQEVEYIQAESVTTDDAITYTIKLREGWTFHNGEPVNADSYIDAWNYYAYGPNAQVNAFELAPIKGFNEMQGESPAATTLSGLTKVDDYTFTVELYVADSQFPLEISDAQTAFYPLPASAFDDIEAYSWYPMGNGPFMLTAAVDDPNQDITVVKYPDYKGPAPGVDQIIFRPYLDMATAYTDALAGVIDVTSVDGSKSSVAQAEFGDRFYALEAPSVDWLGFNPADERFADIRIRQALSMAIDRETVNTAIYSGSQTPATSLTAPFMPGNPDGICGKYCEYHPADAQALLAEAGGIEGQVEILYVGGWGQEDFFEALASQISQNLGIDCVAIPSADFSDFTARLLAGDYDLIRGHWGALYASQKSVLEAAFTEAGLAYYTTHYANSEVDALLAAASAAPTLEESWEGYAAVQERILQDFPTIPTFANAWMYVTSDRIASLPSNSGAPFFNKITVVH